MGYLEETMKMLEMHAEHRLSLRKVALHLQSAFTTFFDEPEPYRYWKKIAMNVIRENPDQLVLTEDEMVTFNPNRTEQLSLLFNEEEEKAPEPEVSKPTYTMGDLFG